VLLYNYSSIRNRNCLSEQNTLGCESGAESRNLLLDGAGKQQVLRLRWIMRERMIQLRPE
jgi:hypothetical protein